MWEIYEMSDYYLNMNKGEIFGMAIMEAVYYKTSVAAIRALGPSVTLKDMKGHKLCENDDEMAEWITGPILRKRICRKALKKWRLHLPGTAAQMPFYRHLLKKAAGKNRNSICQYGKSRV